MTVSTPNLVGLRTYSDKDQCAVLHMGSEKFLTNVWNQLIQSHWGQLRKSYLLQSVSLMGLVITLSDPQIPHL